MKNIVLIIHRSNKSIARYSIPINETTTILEALEYIRTHHDPDLMYRHSCHHGSCGTCGMLIANQRRLACTTNIASLECDEVELHPIPSTSIIGDLATNPYKMFNAFPTDTTYRRAVTKSPPPRAASSDKTSPQQGRKTAHTQEGTPPAEITRYERFEDCIECGLCNSGCPVNFMGPAALAAYNRERHNRPERTQEILDAVRGPKGVDMCVRALVCSRVCPTGVYPAKHIAELRKKIELS